MRRFIPALNVKLDDEKAERVRRNQGDRIDELARMPAAQIKVLEDVSLPDATVTLVPHGLGRRPLAVIPSVPRGATAAGYINELRDDGYDLTKFVVLQADDYGATVTVNVVVL